MTKKLKLPRSLTAKMLCVSLLGLLMAVLLYILVGELGCLMVEKVYMSQENVSQRKAEIYSRLSNYITENQVSGKDTKALSRWAAENEYVTILVYDSGNQHRRFSGEKAVVPELNSEYDKSKYGSLYPLRFSDGMYLVAIVDSSEARDYVVADMVKLHDRISGEYPGLPHIMFGHSMGSFLTRTYIIKHPDKYDAAILSGTGQQAKALVLGGYAAAAASVKLYGPRKIGDKLNDLAFGAYTKGIENPRTSFDWLTRVDSEVDKYIADPLCGFVTTVSLFRDMMGGVKFITNQKNINTMSKTQPIYFMSGDRDPVGDYGKGVDRAYKAFCKAGLHDVMMRLYPGGRHEMLNEENKYQVYKDITAWLDDKLSGMKK